MINLALTRLFDDAQRRAGKLGWLVRISQLDESFPLPLNVWLILKRPLSDCRKSKVSNVFPMNNVEQLKSGKIGQQNLATVTKL